MNIEILCVGKIKEQYLKDALKEYEKRLTRYCNLKISEVADEKTPDKSSTAEEAIVKKKEGERLQRHFREQAYVIALEITGETTDSVGFADILSKQALRSVSDIQFVIGGSLGLDASVLNRADLKLSFSQMTFPHQLMRVILLEQIYRAFRIINQEPYHK